MQSQWNQHNLQSLYDLISSRTGIHYKEHWRNNLIYELEAIDSPVEPSRFIQDLAFRSMMDPLWQRLIHAVTVGETYFYRNKAQFEALRQEVLPTLIAEKRRIGVLHLRLWSAGAATGEEPYSIAMLLHEIIPDIANWTITLLATDINVHYLEAARQGLYTSRSFRQETPDYVRERWFTPEDKRFRLNDTIRKMVIFRPLNLIGDTYPSPESGIINMDLIVCRNVTIYFDQATTKSVVGRFHKTLNKEGWLVVGHSEPMASVYSDFVPRNFTNAVLYQRRENPVAETPPVPVRLPKTRPPTRPVTAPLTPPPPKPAPPAPSPKAEVSKPLSIEELWTQAQQAANEQQWDTALALLDEAEKLSSFQPQIHYLRGLIQLDHEDYSAALFALRRAIYCDPTFIMAHYSLGDLYARQGATREARRHWRLAQSSMDGLPPEQALPYTEDLTVEMLNNLLDYRISTLR